MGHVCTIHSIHSTVLQLSCDIILLDDDGISNPIYMCYGAVTKRLGPDGKLFSHSLFYLALTA